ncbi:hypothetical protein EV561_11764 [Rhizobium sp. BK376]|nr:hypothetical protein EV561_11764 [Rhizobium sp. BK376]
MKERAFPRVGNVSPEQGCRPLFWPLNKRKLAHCSKKTKRPFMAEALLWHFLEIGKFAKHPVKYLEVLATVKQIDITVRGWRTHAKDLLGPASEHVADNSGLSESGGDYSHFLTGVFHHSSQRGSIAIGESVVRGTSWFIVRIGGFRVA